MTELTFSQRMGIKPISEPIKMDHISDGCKNQLWNAVSLNFIDYLSDYAFQTFCFALWDEEYQMLRDHISGYRKRDTQFIRDRFIAGTYYECYDFLEYIIAYSALLEKEERNPEELDTDYMMELFNNILESNFSGYRFIGGILVPITNENETEEIVQALKATANHESNVHLSSSLRLLSNKEEPDYRNSIKESISAVESIAKKISGKPKATLGDALKELSNKGVTIHSALQKGFESIYGYTSDSSGIRHSLSDGAVCSIKDAQFMLVSCSSFINYLIVKANSAGISITS